MRTVIVGVGSNLGAREAAIRAAHALLDARAGISVVAVSRLYETEPLGPPQPRYLNAAYRLQSDLPPIVLLQTLLRIERRLGRDRATSERWGPRSIDLDLLWDQRGPHRSPELCVPHPELERRDFALRPLLDVAPELEASLGRALQRLGREPPPWSRAGVVRSSRRSNGFEVVAEADSVEDALALCVAEPDPPSDPRATLHVTIDPTPEAFANRVQAVCRSGFSVHRTTISHCSQSQWRVQFHGACLGIRTDAHVGLSPTLDPSSRVRARFFASGPS